MHSTLLQLGPLTVRSFGLLMALGFAAAWLALTRLVRGTRHTADDMASLCVWMMLAGVAGARLAYVAEHWHAEFAAQPALIIRIDQGGLMFYGGVAGAFLALIVYARWRRIPLLELGDLLLTVLPLGHAFGRIGCFLNGCCHGRVSTGSLAVVFPAWSPAWTVQRDQGLITATAAQSLPVLPTQLFEAAANLLLFALLFGLHRRLRDRRGTIAGLYFVCYAAIRFLIEPLRGDPRMNVGALSIGQTISILLFAVGLALLVWRGRARPVPEQA